LLVFLDPFDFAHRVFHTDVTTSKIVVLGSIVGLIVRRAPVAVLNAPATKRVLAMALLIIAATLATLASAYYIDAVAREAFKALEYALLFAVAAIATAAQAREREIVRTIAASIVVTCAIAIVALGAGGSSITQSDGTIAARLSGPLEGPNQLAGYFDVLAPVMLAAALASRQIVFVAVVALCVVCDVLTDSRAGLLGLYAGSAFVFARLGSTARVAIARGIGAIAIAVAALATIAVARPALFERTNDFGSGLGTRSELWPAAIAFFKHHPILGIGAGNFELQLARVGLVDVHTHANSLYLQSLAEGGIVLFLATLAAPVVALATYGFARTRDPLVLGAAGATMALIVHQLFDDLTFFPKVGGLYWIVLGIAAGSLARTQIAHARKTRSHDVAIAWSAVAAVYFAALLAWHGPKAVSDAATASRFNIANGRAIPIGVVETARQRSADVFRGLYPNNASDPFCCWLAPKARLETIAPAGASTMIVALLVPNLPFFSHGGQHVALTLESKRHEIDFVRPGLQRISIALDARAVPKDLVLRIETTRTLVPKREHLNGDTRALGVVLQGIGFRTQAL
jgi:O-antigen ligase